ncbi:hypothetical protein [Nocardioides sp. T2.26MG-1]|uniref:hypothetical protein n=1 Tax=Nocardioides sp. T2.26MG-1 TaxID=3041166 RepID=UPI0025426647|nr:hypothetical protein [Nocardioides sp. T2.26MG-1]
MWARAALLGAAMLGTGTVSHVSAGGLLPHPVALLVLATGFVALAGRFLLGPASTRRIVTLVVVGQGAAHTALSALAGHRGDGGTAAPDAHHGPHQVLSATLPLDGDGRRVGSLLDAYSSAPVTAGHDGPGVPLGALSHLVHHLAEQGPLMLAAHLAAAVVLGLVLAVGERALWALVHLAAARVVVLAAAGRSAAAALAVLRGAAAAPRPRPRATGFVPLPRLDRPALSRRGPPALLAV